MTARREVDVPKVDPHKRGRRTGSTNRKTVESLKELRADGKELPVPFLLRQMRNAKNDMEYRRLCAKEAAPYIHPKLSTITHVGDPQKPLINAQMPEDVFRSIVQKMLDHV